MQEINRRHFMAQMAGLATLAATASYARTKPLADEGAKIEPAPLPGLCDWHIHSMYSPCGKKETTLEMIQQQAIAAGRPAFGVTDHLHCRLNVPRLRECRAAYDRLHDRKGFYFGVEVSAIRPYDLRKNDERGEEGSIYGVQTGGPEEPPTLFLPDELLEELNVDYLIGGAHWTLGAEAERMAVIRSYHRQNMFLATHPQVDIVAHPWWWLGKWKNENGIFDTLPWLDDFGVIPRSMHDECAAAAIESGTAVEINTGACLLNKAYPEHFQKQYIEYLLYLKERGVTFSLGSDSHAVGYGNSIGKAAPLLDALKLDAARLWRPEMGKHRRA